MDIGKKVGCNMCRKRINIGGISDEYFFLIGPPCVTIICLSVKVFFSEANPNCIDFTFYTELEI